MNMLELFLEFQRLGLHKQTSPEQKRRAKQFFDDLDVSADTAEKIMECTGPNGWCTAVGDTLNDLIQTEENHAA